MGQKMAAHEDGIEHCGKFQAFTAKDLIMHTDAYVQWCTVYCAHVFTVDLCGIRD